MIVNKDQEKLNDPRQVWIDYNTMVERMVNMLRCVDIQSGGTDKRDLGTLNQLQLNDIQYATTKVMEQLDHLDDRHRWRAYMAVRRNRKKVTLLDSTECDA